MNTVAVIGLGYVGLPLALVFAEAQVNVIGIDVDSDKVEKLEKAETYIDHIPSTRIKQQIDNERLQTTTDFKAVSKCDAVIICGPTPLNPYREPDLSYVLSTGKSIAKSRRSVEG